MAESILSAVVASGEIDALIIDVNMTVILRFRRVDMLGNIIASAMKVRERHRNGMHVGLVLRSDGDAETENRKREYRMLAIAKGVPVFDELPQACGLLALRSPGRLGAGRRTTLRD